MVYHCAKKYGRLKRGISALLCVGMAVSAFFTPQTLRAAGNDPAPQTVGSRVVYDGEGYERELALEVGGEPFFYNGVQIRIDKVADLYHYDDARIKQLIQRAKDDGFTVANMQIRWSDVQPDVKIHTKQSGSISQNEPDKTQGNTLKAEGAEGKENLTYLQFDLEQFQDRQSVEAAKLRVNVPSEGNSLQKDHVLYGYDVTGQAADADLSALTWETAPVKDTEGLKGSATAVWDPVREANYYDIDVTDFVNAQLGARSQEITLLLSAAEKGSGNCSETITLDNGADAPQLIISEDKDKYDWSYLDKIIGWSEEIGIKMEVLWFATDTCSITADNRVPYYVHRNYQLSMAGTDKPFFAKQTGGMADAYGIYWYLMCKNDPRMQAQEASALKAMFDHIGEYNAQHGGRNTVIGCQVSNEPNVSRLHNGGVKDVDGNRVPHCMCDNCKSLKASLGLDDQGFRDYSMFTYNNNLSKAVKTSAYPVWTRVNNVQGNDAWGVAYNERMRKAGGTDTDAGTYLDFIGLDPYGWGRNDLYKFGTGSYAQGQNLPVVMESGGEKSMSALMMLGTVAGGGFYNVYDLCSPDGHHLYDEDMQPRVIAAGDKYLPNGGTYIEDVRAHNHLLNKVAYELAVKKPDSLGGRDLLFFNCEGTDNAKINVVKKIDGMDVRFQSNTQFASGIAIKRSGTEAVLLNTIGKDATFTLSQIGNDLKSAEAGHYEGAAWVADADAAGNCHTEGSSLVVSMPAFSCIRIETSHAFPEPACYEAEALEKAGKVTASNGLTINNWKDAEAHGGGWLEIKNAPVGAKITFRIDVPENLSEAQIVTGYKSNTSGRAVVQLAVNGADYGAALDMAGNYGYTSAAPGPTIKLKSGQENTFVYTVTKAGTVCFDYIDLIKQDPMPEELDGLALIQEDFTNGSGSFGFSSGCSVANGALNLTQGMENYTASVKRFGAEVIGQSMVDVSFDWRTNIASNGKKTGIEFRDLYGRLVFAVASKGGTELRTSTTGWDSDSSQCEYDWEPVWDASPMERGKTYRVRFQADFKNKMVSYSVAEKSSQAVVAQKVNVPIKASGLAKMVAANYYTVEGTAYDGTQQVDNLSLLGRDRLELPYAGKTAYVFGDDIAKGYLSTEGFAAFAAAAEGMTVSYNGAADNARITAGASQVMLQAEAAPEAAPDVILFNGGMHDAQDVKLDKDAFAAAFEETIQKMQQKWKGAEIVYVTTHKTGGADEKMQDALYEIGTSICQKYGVKLADLYGTSMLNAREDNIRWNYTFDELGQDKLPGTMATTSSEKYSGFYPSGIHPNFAGIETFYVPAVSKALRTKPEAGKALSECRIFLNPAVFTYNGKEQKPSVTVKDGEKELKEGKDYALSYQNNKNAGKAKAVITGKGAYTGTAEETFTICRASQSLSCANVRKAYGGKAFTLGVKRKTGNGIFTYVSANKKVASVNSKGKVSLKGTGSTTITVRAAATDNYNAASIKVRVDVSPKKQKAVSLKVLKGKKLSVKWKRDSRATGYQIQYSTDKKMKKGLRSVWIRKRKTASKTIPKLVKGKKYYVRIRSYKNAKINGKTQKLCGAWSSAKKSGRIQK